jgi:hypothetical protein
MKHEPAALNFYSFEYSCIVFLVFSDFSTPFGEPLESRGLYRLNL